MKHFSVIQSLCRIGLENENEKFRQQVERLRDRLKQDKMDKEVDAIERLLNADSRAIELTPSKVELSRSLVRGEQLTSNVHPPVDKETSAPLADVILNPSLGSIKPVFSSELAHSINSIINEWGQYDKLHALGVEPPRSCLLFGAPGTGKTLTAFYIASKLGLPIVSAKLDGLVSSFLGTTARNIANLFDFANRYRCILLLDEFDAIAKVRDDPQEVGEIKRVVNTLLQNLDQRASLGITIAITNHEGLLDSAIWRRFEVRIEMPLPDFSQRRSLIEQYISPISLKENYADFLAWLTKDYTGADIKTMLNSVKRVLVLSKNEQVEDFLPALGFYTMTNASKIKKGNFHLLAEDPKQLAKDLHASKEAKFTQTAIANIFNKDQTTVSRWLNESEEA